MTFAFAPALAACAALGAGLFSSASMAAEAGDTQVHIQGRTWIVSPAEDATGRYSALRLNRALKPFRPPAMISARQAARAFKAATGCTASRDTIVRTISGVYYAELNCPRQ